MKRINAHMIALVFGSFLGLWHTCWGLLVWLGGAQPLLDFVFHLHMIEPPYKVAAFSLTTAVSLVVVTTAIGYIFGWTLGIIWNLFGGPPMAPKDA